MTMEEFDFLHELIKSDIYKQNTQFRRAISTEKRLAVCLRYVIIIINNYNISIKIINILFKIEYNFLSWYIVIGTGIQEEIPLQVRSFCSLLKSLDIHHWNILGLELAMELRHMIVVVQIVVV